MVTTMALKVPRGMALHGFFKLPERLAPAIIPVAAGKKIEKTHQKFPSSNLPVKGTVFCTGVEVRKNEIKERLIIPRIKYQVLMAKCVLMEMITSKTIQVRVEIKTGLWAGKIRNQPSVKPTM